MSNQDYKEQHSMTPWSESSSKKLEESIPLDESIAMKTVQALRSLGWRDPNNVRTINARIK